MHETRLRRAGTVFEDIGLLMGIVVVIPVGILLVGAPFAALAWLVTAARRLF